MPLTNEIRGRLNRIFGPEEPPGPDVQPQRPGYRGQAIGDLVGGLAERAGANIGTWPAWAEWFNRPKPIPEELGRPRTALEAPGRRAEVGRETARQFQAPPEPELPPTESLGRQLGRGLASTFVMPNPVETAAYGALGFLPMESAASKAAGTAARRAAPTLGEMAAGEAGGVGRRAAKKLPEVARPKIDPGEVFAHETGPTGSKFEYRISLTSVEGAPQLKYRVQMRMPGGSWESANTGASITPEGALDNFVNRVSRLENIEPAHPAAIAARKEVLDARAAEEATRQVQKKAEELAYKEQQIRREEIDNAFAKASFKQQSTRIKGSEGTNLPEAKGPSIGGLVVHSTGEGKGKRWGVTHQVSGLAVGPGYKSQNEAKIFAFRLSQLTDWTQSAEVIKKQMKRIGPATERMRQDVYADLSDVLSEKPVKPSPKVEAPAAQAKQPWEMTKGEFVQERLASLKEVNPVAAEQQQAKLTQAGETLHGKYIRQALSEGKPVPPEVLADYPDLAAQAKPVVAPEAAPGPRPAAPPSFDEAVERAIEQGRTPSTYRIPGTEPNLAEVRRLKQNAYKQVLAFRNRVKGLGPQAGSARLELLKAESYWKELTLLEKQVSTRVVVPPAEAVAPRAAEAELGQIKLYRMGSKGNFFSTSKEYARQSSQPTREYPGLRELPMPEDVKLLDARSDFTTFTKLATPAELGQMKALGLQGKERSELYQRILERNGYDGMRSLDEGSGEKIYETIFLNNKVSPDFAAPPAKPSPPKVAPPPAAQAGAEVPPARPAVPPRQEIPPVKPEGELAGLEQALREAWEAGNPPRSIIELGPIKDQKLLPAGRGTPPVVAASAGSSGNDGAAGILRAATNPPDTLSNPLSSRGIMQDWQGRLNVGAAEARREWKAGQDLLKVKGIGQGGSQGHRIVSQAEGEGLLKALHGEGPVPKGQEAVFAEAKRLLAEIQEADLAAAPELTGKFMAHPDYMPRLWIPPPSPRVKPGGKPFFLKPRVDATFSELLEAGYQPASWNPFDMIALRRLSSVEWRAQREFMPLLQRDGYVKLASEAPKGWRVPDAPGFRSRPTIMPTGEPAFTPALATPNYVADIMESMYGYRPTLRVGDVDVMGAWTKVTNWAKSTKLIGSLFQHVDMSIRAEAAAFRTEGLLRGAPLKTPALTVRLFMASLLPGQRGVMLNKMLSGKALYKDFPISLKDVADHGWEIGGDTSIFGRTVKSAMEEVLTEGAPKNIASKALQRVKRVNQWWQDGLFEGVYRESQSFALENAIIPAIRRSHPDWTVEQVARAAAEVVNVQFSTLAPWQTVFRQPAMKAVVRNLVFSPNESESWLRAAFQSFKGQNKWAYADNFIGLGIFMAGLANVINLVSEGKLLPADAYTPIRVGDPYAFLPGGVSYNNRFLSPMLPVKGRNDEPLYLDVVGQADTVFRWLMNPPEALASRENVPIRAAATQIGGETFFGKPLTSLEERGKQFAQDIAMPIGAGSGAEALRQAIPQTQRFIPEGESRLGVTGSLVQTSGLNIRGMPTPELLDSIAQNSGMVQTDGQPVTSWWELSGKQKNDLIAQNPNLKAELEARDITAAETMQPGPLRKAYVREAVKAQEERDDWLEKGKDKWGKPYGPEQWREERESAQVASAAVREIFDQLRNQKYPEPRNDNQKAAKGYYEEMEKFQYKDSFNTEGWMEARDKYLAKLPDAQAKFVLDSLHPNATETERKYLAAQETLRPYWELKDTIEEAVIAKYPDFANVLDSIKWYEAHAAEGQNRQKATALRARQPYKVYKATLKKYQNDLRSKDKDVESALLQWGYVTVPIQEKLRENRPSLLRR